MRRLYSSFANGAPGSGLLLMRLATGTALIVRAFDAFGAGAPIVAVVFGVLSLSTGVLLLIGLWTPVAGVLCATLAGWQGLSNPSELTFQILLSVLGVALALLGPGAWSVDARLFGWKRIEIRNGKATRSASSNNGDEPSPI